MNRYCKYIALAATLLTVACSQDTLLEEDILQDTPITRTDDSVFTAKKYIESYLREGTEGYQVMFQAIKACGLLDDLAIWRDMEYEKLYQKGWINDLYDMLAYGFPEGRTAYAPEHRDIGYTIFAETDDFWLSQGIEPKAADLCGKLTKWIQDNGEYSDAFTTDGNYASPQHLLYQWVTYHILPMYLTPDRLVFHINEYGFHLSDPTNLGVPVYEYYATMGNRRLFKLYESKESKGVYINRFPMLDNGRMGTGHEIGCDPDKVGARICTDSPLAETSAIVNACIYPIDAPIWYTDDVRQNLGNERIRFDVMSISPEAMTNNIRLARDQNTYVCFPREYDYFENISFGSNTAMVYYNTWNYGWCNLQGDELKAVGLYDVTIKLPPVPTKGVYELRYKVLANSNRGKAQVYFGSDQDRMDAIGLPLDLTLSPRSSQSVAAKIGWEDDTSDEEHDAMVDKRLHNNGFMKGAQSICGSNGPQRSIDNSDNIRYILLEQTLDPDKTYYVRFKSVLSNSRREFYADYFELCPQSVYHNRYQPEDIW